MRTRPGGSPRRVRRSLLSALAIVLGLVWVFPVYWMAVTAFKQDADLYRMDGVPFWFHLPPTLEHFARLFKSTYFTVQLLNTLQLAVCVVALTMVMAVPAGYALARLRLPGAENIGIAIFLTYLVPPIILFIPLARVVGALGVFDSWWALVIVYPGFTIPFCTWKMMGYFKTVPLEVEEAAWLDGCSRLGSLCRLGRRLGCSRFRRRTTAGHARQTGNRQSGNSLREFKLHGTLLGQTELVG